MEAPREERFGSSEVMLRYFQERSEDLEKVVVHPPGQVLTFEGRQMTKPFPGFMLMMHFINGDRKCVRHPDDIEMVLNDGILRRMKIKIELFKMM